jgi:hypothetical protein
MASIDNSHQILQAAHGFAEQKKLPDIFEVCPITISKSATAYLTSVAYSI